MHGLFSALALKENRKVPKLHGALKDALTMRDGGLPESQGFGTSHFKAKKFESLFTSWFVVLYEPCSLV